jgi:nitrite reductase/ring-hydroxylating ferredoxin subunit
MHARSTEEQTGPAMSGEYVAALPLGELAPGRMCAVEIGGRDVLLCHTKEGVAAFDNVCSHAQARMSEGRLRGTRLICPLHGASFDARDGRVLTLPATAPLCRHAVRITDGMIEIALSASTPVHFGM